MPERTRRLSFSYSRRTEKRCPSILFLYAGHKYKGLFTKDSNECTALIIEKYNSILNSCELDAKIVLNGRGSFGVNVLKSIIYIMGGIINGAIVKSVSTTQMLQFCLNTNVYNSFFSDETRSQGFALNMNSGGEAYFPEMITARADFASVIFGRYIYVFGGRDESGPMNACER